MLLTLQTKLSNFISLFLCLLIVPIVWLILSLFNDDVSSITQIAQVFPLRHVHISSAYFVVDTDSDGNTTKAIRMFALAEKGIQPLELDFSCQMDGQVTKPLVEQSGNPVECKLSTYIIDCVTDIQPANFSLIGPNQTEHQLKLTVPDPTPRKVVICFSRMFYYEKWQVALASLEIYKALGVDLMVIPISSVIEAFHRILQAYEKEGSVRLKPAVHIPQFADLDFDPNTESEWFQQVTAFSECLYEYRESTEFILTLDMDDLILPKNFDSLPDELNALANQFQMAASFEFLWSWTQTRGYNSTETFSISRMIRESTRIHKNLINFGKSAVRPKRIRQPSIHHPSEKERLRGFLHQRMGENETLSFHFRSFVFDESPIPNNNLYFSNRSIYSGLDQKFHEFLQRNPTAKAAFSKLPNQYPYSTAMINCYIDIGNRMVAQNLVYCRNPMQCKPNATAEMPECVVLEQEHKITYLSDQLHVSTPISSRFELRKNCLE